MAPLVVGLALGLLAVAFHGLVDALAIGAKPGLVVWAFAGLLAGVRVNAHRWTPAASERQPLARQAKGSYFDVSLPRQYPSCASCVLDYWNSIPRRNSP